MLKKMEIVGVHMTPDDRLIKYTRQKIGNLDRFIPRKSRQSVHAEIKLKEAKAADKSRYTCEVVLHLPHDIISTHERTINMYAAVDIVEAKLKNQLKKYKDLHASPKLYRRLATRLGNG